MTVNLQIEGLDWLEKSTILLAPTGSYAYGTATEDSDRDYKGVCIPPMKYYLGLDSFNAYDSSGGKNFRNTKYDTDIIIMHINKFVKDALEGVPNNIEILFVAEDQFLLLDPLGKILVDNRHEFLSQKIINKFGGFGHSQRKKLEYKLGAGTGRVELIEKHGYDTKLFMHSVRLYTSAVEILMTGTFATYRPNRELLLDCRNGKYRYNEAMEMIDEFENLLREAAKKTHLPKTPNYHAINKMLIDINMQGLGLREAQDE